MRRAPAPLVRRFARFWLAGLLAFALAGTALAHRAAPNTQDLALAQFLAAGGTLADLCHSDHTPHHSAESSCDACRLIGAALLSPAPMLLAFQRTPVPAHGLWPDTAPPHSRAPPSNHSARAPPAI